MIEWIGLIVVVILLGMTRSWKEWGLFLAIYALFACFVAFYSGLTTNVPLEERVEAVGTNLAIVAGASAGFRSSLKRRRKPKKFILR